MASIIIKDIPTENENEFIEVSMYYSLGGYNVWTGDNDRRGYWLSVSKVEKGDGWVKQALFEGRKMFLKEVKRKSKKAEKEALTIAMEKYPEMVRRVYGEVA